MSTSSSSSGNTGAPTIVKKKVDSRIGTLIENGIRLRNRTILVVVGDRGRDQVVILHQILSKSSVRTRPSVLWCYKKDLGFTTHQQKRAKKIKRDIARGIRQADENNPFDTFIGGTDIRYAYYKDSHKILGNTYGMLILQDFEAITPNLLARTIETVEGGGLVVLLIKTMSSLKQLYTMTMDVHKKYRTGAHVDVVPRFNERLVLSLADCASCLVVDDELNILPISSHVRNIKKIKLDREIDAKGDSYMTDSDIELSKLKLSMKDTQPVGALIDAARTFDQGKAIMKFVEAIAEKTLRSTVVLTAARGRGKSAAMGLSIAGAIAYGYSNIYVTAPSPENLRTLFEMVLLGFDKLDYKEHQDYEIVQSTNKDYNGSIVRINVFHSHRQTIQYILPSDHQRLTQAELLVIDEAAAIPLPTVTKLLGPYLVFMSSTVNGYEGTGRSLSLKLVRDLRHQSASSSSSSSSDNDNKTTKLGGGSRVLTEITLEDPIRYGRGDLVERWLNDLLCLDCTNHVPRLIYAMPHPSLCDLYYVNRDTLFSHHKASESFLQRMVALFVSSHYKNTPNDLQMMSDAPGHHLFVLLVPQTQSDQPTLPDVLCVVQVALEGEITRESVQASMARGQKPAGDMIPWTMLEQYGSHEFPTLSGARVVRIATHPELTGKGYGGRALELLSAYYEGKLTSLKESDDTKETKTPVNESKKDKKKSKKDKEGKSESKAENGDASPTSVLSSEELAPRAELPPLLQPLTKRSPEFLHWVGVGYGLTTELFRFWHRAGYRPVNLAGRRNEQTGEYSFMMIKQLHSSSLAAVTKEDWLSSFCDDFQTRFYSMLSYQYSTFHVKLALLVADPPEALFKAEAQAKGPPQSIGVEVLQSMFRTRDLVRLDKFTRLSADWRTIHDLIPKLAGLFFEGKLGTCRLSGYVQAAILLGIGLQRKTIDQICEELDVKPEQIIAMLKKTIIRIYNSIKSIEEAAVRAELPADQSGSGLNRPELKQSLEADLAEGGKQVTKAMKERQKVLGMMNLEKFAITGSEEQWTEATAANAGGKNPSNISLKGDKSKVKIRNDSTSSKKGGGGGKRGRDAGSKKGGDKKARTD